MEIINHSHIEALGGLESPDLIEIIEDFLSDLDTNLTELCQFARDTNHELLREPAHRLKGGASMSGFPALAAVAADLEKSSQAENFQTSEAEIMARLTPAIQDARSAFKMAVKSAS